MSKIIIIFNALSLSIKSRANLKQNSTLCFLIMIFIVFIFIDLMESLSSWLEKHMDDCKQHILISYLLTSAFINYKPNNIDTIIKVIIFTFEKFSY